MKQEISRAITEGLVVGYAGGAPGRISRSDFEGRVSHVEKDGTVYHDEWFVGERAGGGQELVSVSDVRFTRLYAGGTPDIEVLEKLGITAKDVSKYLKGKITERDDKTRLFEDCIPEPDGDWQYSYRIMSRDESIGVTTGVESINYKNETVHIHAFILCPIE